MITDHSKGF